MLTDVDWFQNTDGTWTYSGNWQYTNKSGNGTLFGTASGTYNGGAIDGVAILLGGTGPYTGYEGVGNIAGTGLPGADGIPSTFDGVWTINIM